MAAKKKIRGESTQVSIRIAEDVLSDADTLIDMMTERTGIPATRVDVLRAALVRGLREMKRERERELA